MQTRQMLTVGLVPAVVAIPESFARNAANPSRKLGIARPVETKATLGNFVPNAVKPNRKHGTASVAVPKETRVNSVPSVEKPEVQRKLGNAPAETKAFQANSARNAESQRRT